MANTDCLYEFGNLNLFICESDFVLGVNIPSDITNRGTRSFDAGNEV